MSIILLLLFSCLSGEAAEPVNPKYSIEEYPKVSRFTCYRTIDKELNIVCYMCYNDTLSCVALQSKAQE